MSYVLGVSSGYFSVTGAEEKPQLAGLFKKAQSSMTKGVTFVQLDLESVSEFYEPSLKEKMKKDVQEKLGIKYGIHSETKAAGVEAAELDSAIKMEYDRAHKRIVEILKNSKEIESKYVLVHSSESEPFPLLERTLQSCDLVDIDGGKLNDFLEKNTILIDWVLGGATKDLLKSVFDVWIVKGASITADDISKGFKEKNIKPADFIFAEMWGGSNLSTLLKKEIDNTRIRLEISNGKKYEESMPEEKKLVDERIKSILEVNLNEYRSHLVEFVQSRTLHYGPERLAYYLMAKWMELNKEPLWEKIVKASIMFFSKKDGKNIEEWVSNKKINLQKPSIDDDNFRKITELWVPAVSARYIYGHFFPKNPEYEDPRKYLENMIFAFESPMGGRGIEEWLRLGNPYLYYFLVDEANKKFGKEIFGVALDFEHMLSLRIDPGLVIELLPENGGRSVRVVHAGWPTTLAPSHLPIHLGSEQQLYLYKMYYLLRKKGFGLDTHTDHFIVFERGGPETFQESVISLRKIIEFLEKDTAPEKLTGEFFGVATGEIASEERQLATIKEHAREPLKGLITVPEEEYTFLSRAAVEKGTPPEKWKKEELK